MTLTIEQATEQFNTHTEKFLNLTASSLEEEAYEANLGAHIIAQSSSYNQLRPTLTDSVQFRTYYKHFDFKEYYISDNIIKDNKLAIQVVTVLTDAGVLESLHAVAFGKLQPMPVTQ